MVNVKIGGRWEDIADGNNQIQKDFGHKYCKKCGRERIFSAYLTRCECCNHIKQTKDSIFLGADVIEKCPICDIQNNTFVHLDIYKGCEYNK